MRGVCDTESRAVTEKVLPPLCPCASGEPGDRRGKDRSNLFPERWFLPPELFAGVDGLRSGSLVSLILLLF